MSNVTKVSYSKSYEMILREGTVWEKIGLEAELGEEETPEQGLSELKVIVDTFHKEHLPQPTEEDTYTTVPVKKKEKRIPDLAIRQKYAKAAAASDNETILKLESEYLF